MPLEFVGDTTAHGCSCEGLLGLFRAECDIHIAPPRRFFGRTESKVESNYPPPPVLAAFGVILEEAGGALRDVYGEMIDFNAIADAKVYDSTLSVRPAEWHAPRKDTKFTPRLSSSSKSVQNLTPSSPPPFHIVLSAAASARHIGMR